MPACREARDGVGIVSGAAGLAVALWVGGVCVREGGRAGRISSLQRWLLG